MLAFAAMDVHQSEPSMFNGNAPTAESTLMEHAPGAPVAQRRSTNGGAGN
jgi:hypothetical protein